MVWDDHMWRGRALRIAVGTLLVFLVLMGGAGALSNGRRRELGIFRDYDNKSGRGACGG